MQEPDNSCLGGNTSGIQSWEYKGSGHEKEDPSPGVHPGSCHEGLAEAGWEQEQVCRQTGSRCEAQPCHRVKQLLYKQASQH